MTSIAQIRQTAIVDFLKSIGCVPVKETLFSAWFHAPYREDETASLKVNKHRNLWVDFTTAQSGDIIDLGILIYRTRNMTRVLKMIECGTPAVPMFQRSYIPVSSESRSIFKGLHIKALTCDSLISYLLKRGIDLNIAITECREAHYTCHGKAYQAIAFSNIAGGYEIRSCHDKGCISPRGISLPHPVHAKTICLFEEFIDYLSFLTLQKQKRLSFSCGTSDYIVLNSVNNLSYALTHLKNYRDIYCFSDNNDEGRRIVNIIQEMRGKQVYNLMETYPLYKDLNDLLRGKMKMP